MLSWCVSVFCRQKLEEKARLYEQMTKGDFPGTMLAWIPKFMFHFNNFPKDFWVFSSIKMNISNYTIFFCFQMRKQKVFFWWTSPRRSSTRGMSHRHALQIEMERTLMWKSPFHLHRTQMRNGTMCFDTVSYEI